MVLFLENYLNEIETVDDFYYNPMSLLPKLSYVLKLNCLLIFLYPIAAERIKMLQ